jgi:tripeptide aminopeptidase
VEKYPGSRYEARAGEQYRNMKEAIYRHPEVLERAFEAIRRLGMEPRPGSIRGGTDGAKLSFMGVPCPNISDGAYNYHSPLEFVAVQDMEMAVRTIVELARVWEEKI